MRGVQWLPPVTKKKFILRISPDAASPFCLYDFTCKIRMSPAQDVTPQRRKSPLSAPPHPILLTLRLAATPTRSGSHSAAAPTYFLMNFIQTSQK